MPVFFASFLAFFAARTSAGNDARMSGSADFNLAVIDCLPMPIQLAMMIRLCRFIRRPRMAIV
jgi:hypothetical protein